MPAGREILNAPLNEEGLDTIFRTARTRRGWTDESVPEALIRSVYDLHKWGPTSGNICPGRYLFIQSEAAKKRLDALMDEGNRKQTFAAPWTCIVAYDLEFPRFMAKLAPWMKDPARTFADDSEREWLAVQNGSLGAAYLMIAARALGLDCGPMNGFDRDGVNREFFMSDPKMKSWRVNFVLNLGHGDDTRLHPRGARLDFDEAAAIF